MKKVIPIFFILLQFSILNVKILASSQICGEDLPLLKRIAHLNNLTKSWPESFVQDLSETILENQQFDTSASLPVETINKTLQKYFSGLIRYDDNPKNYISASNVSISTQRPGQILKVHLEDGKIKKGFITYSFKTATVEVIPAIRIKQAKTFIDLKGRITHLTFKKGKVALAKKISWAARCYMDSKELFSLDISEKISLDNTILTILDQDRVLSFPPYAGKIIIDDDMLRISIRLLEKKSYYPPNNPSFNRYRSQIYNFANPPLNTTNNISFHKNVLHEIINQVIGRGLFISLKKGLPHSNPTNYLKITKINSVKITQNNTLIVSAAGATKLNFDYFPKIKLEIENVLMELAIKIIERNNKTWLQIKSHLVSVRFKEGYSSVKDLIVTKINQTINEKKPYGLLFEKDITAYITKKIKSKRGESIIDPGFTQAAIFLKKNELELKLK